jgi:CheY-like chemotaxis protein
VSAASGPSGDPAPWSVLIVDDDPFIRRLIATTLAGVAAMQLHEAPDGVAALAVARQHAPALVFLDVDMPEMNGIETCRELRALEQTRGARIVMLTAGAEREQEAREAGADLFLTKPFSPLELLRLVDELNAARPAG